MHARVDLEDLEQNPVERVEGTSPAPAFELRSTCGQRRKRNPVRVVDQLLRDLLDTLESNGAGELGLGLAVEDDRPGEAVEDPDSAKGRSREVRFEETRNTDLPDRLRGWRLAR